jgi:hypothetical protein
MVRLTFVGTTALAVARTAIVRWVRSGANDREVGMPLPGDVLLGRADLMTTRAITIGAPADAVWPWIAQIGQGRGGFYSYDFLENLAGCDIHSTERIVPEWQDVSPGTRIKLAPAVALSVAVVEPQRTMVLRGGVRMGAIAAPYRFTWAFVLDSHAGGSTRLIVRERYEYRRRWAPLLVVPVQLISTIMTRRMLRGIKERSQRAAGQAPASVMAGRRAS